MFIAFCFVALFIAWIWVDYFRMIDIYERESPVYFLITFILGAASVGIVLIIEDILKGLSFNLNGSFINDFFYCVIRIGVVEEFAKFIPFLIVFRLFTKEINEPIDYFVYLSISALGFSAAENVIYFNNHGANLIIARSILATLSHIFDTSLIACGFIIYKYKTHRHPYQSFLLFFMLAALAHGFYDFWLIYKETQGIGVLVTIIYFFFTISIFATILNNALNNSTFFSYRKVIDSKMVSTKMLLYYLVVFIIQTLLVTIKDGPVTAAKGSIITLLMTGFIVTVAVVRLSRFKLIPGKWNRIIVELPFTIRFLTGKGNPVIDIHIKGDSFNEAHVNAFYEEYFLLFSFSEKHSDIEFYRNAYIEKKLFLHKDETYYLAKIFNPQDAREYHYRLLKPKTTNITMKRDRYPIVAVLNFDHVADFENHSNKPDDFVFETWAYIKPFQES